MSRRYAGVEIALVVAFMIGTCQAKLKDGCKLETLQACGDDYLPYGKGPHLATSGEPFVKQCGTFKEQIMCSKNFVRDCLDGASKAAALVALETYKESIDEICTTGSKQNEAYHKSVGCLNSVGAKLHGCVNSLLGNINKAVLKAPQKDVIAHVCCSYGGLLDCVEPALTPCEKVGGKEFTLSLVDKVLGEVLTPFCKNYKRGSDSCKALPNLPALGPHDRKFKSFVELIIEAVHTAILKN
ncbi:uncharacterized protein LOC119373555 [Rhipicephalus sanguineus]|uniref:uncharacterized protein LOC119373555 n=1 Tax=Rhipicephalus sanguineus TaxID=34632 RepID=UPI0020C3B6F3|nr:uncharacterized protein LOC119373555 [Rhipicephalus sanguineus]